MSVFGHGANFTGGAFSTLTQLLLYFTFSSISLSIFVQKTYNLIKAFILAIPGWLVWKSFNICFFSAPGITTHLLYSKIPLQMEKICSLSVFLYCWSIICFLFSVMYLSFFSLCLIYPWLSLVIPIWFRKVCFLFLVAITIFFLFLVAITVSSNSSHGLGINLDNPSAGHNLFDWRNSILTL